MVRQVTSTRPQPPSWMKRSGLPMPTEDGKTASDLARIYNSLRLCDLRARIAVRAGGLGFMWHFGSTMRMRHLSPAARAIILNHPNYLRARAEWRVRAG
jgi:hypothetical protein